MYELPTTIIINDKEHPITNKGDFRMIIDGCFGSLNDPELDKQYRVASALVCFYEELNSLEDIQAVFGDDTQEAIEEMYNFFQCYETTVGYKTERGLVDWEKDSNLICSAVNKVAPVVDIRAEQYIHWFTFMSWYLGVGECLWAQVIGIREKITKGKKLEKWESEFRRNNPEYFEWKTIDQIEIEEELQNLIGGD